jgi:hypothetical protein
LPDDVARFEWRICRNVHSAPPMLTDELFGARIEPRALPHVPKSTLGATVSLADRRAERDSVSRPDFFCASYSDPV